MKKWYKMFFGNDGKYRLIPFVGAEPEITVPEMIWDDNVFWNDSSNWTE